VGNHPGLPGRWQSVTSRYLRDRAAKRTRWQSVAARRPGDRAAKRTRWQSVAARRFGDRAAKRTRWQSVATRRPGDRAAKRTRWQSVAVRGSERVSPNEPNAPRFCAAQNAGRWTGTPCSTPRLARRHRTKPTPPDFAPRKTLVGGRKHHVPLPEASGSPGRGGEGPNGPQRGPRLSHVARPSRNDGWVAGAGSSPPWALGCHEDRGNLPQPPDVWPARWRTAPGPGSSGVKPVRATHLPRLVLLIPATRHARCRVHVVRFH
jgi:hypothetical protein